jgi:hypothetical protein
MMQVRPQQGATMNKLLPIAAIAAMLLALMAFAGIFAGEHTVAYAFTKFVFSLR